VCSCAVQEYRIRAYVGAGAARKPRVLKSLVWSRCRSLDSQDYDVCCISYFANLLDSPITVYGMVLIITQFVQYFNNL
jgi:hypothetical protein